MVEFNYNAKLFFIFIKFNYYYKLSTNWHLQFYKYKFRLNSKLFCIEFNCYYKLSTNGHL